MKYFLFLLLLIGSANAQDTPVFAEPNGMTNKGSTLNNGLSITGSTLYVSLDTPWMLSHGWKLVDTVKWKPYYQKKKHHPRNDTFYIGANDAHTSSGDLIIRGKDVRFGGQLQRNQPINFDSFYLSAHGLIPKYKDSINSIKGYTWDFWDKPVEVYPWWKKALWMVFGQLTMLITYLIIIRFPNNFKS